MTAKEYRVPSEESSDAVSVAINIEDWENEYDPLDGECGHDVWLEKHPEVYDEND